ncbi:hypothetical protein [Candidatus Liberibacter sp.]|uniref:hypothetical protein n=1 Tax=Candidatus Liberibacter sp. TaxID=34022 RepID=UPI0015F64FC2|nr:hypothetical protein [Candidatus Liberibacter sp.]MBA5724610.1 hypothetical protein [Candidatus Liberibacter sp.]
MVKTIRALRDIPLHDVKKGDLGGYVESEDNLSQEGECWVGRNGMVLDCSIIIDNALVEGIVSEDAIIGGETHIDAFSQVRGKVGICGNALLKNCTIYPIG